MLKTQKTQFSGLHLFHTAKPPRMSSPCGLLREMAAKESLDRIGSKFISLAYSTHRELRRVLSVLVV